MKKLLVALTLIFIPVIAHALPITLKFAGTVGTCFICSISVPSGTAFYGQYTFDSQAIDQNPDPDKGFYSFSGAPYGGMITLAGQTTTWTDFQISVLNNAPHITPTHVSDKFILASGSFILSLQACNGDAFDDDSLSPINLNSFRPNCSLGDEVVIHGNPPIFEAFGSLTLLDGPPSLLLLGSGLVLGGLYNLRRRWLSCRI